MLKNTESTKIESHQLEIEPKHEARKIFKNVSRNVENKDREVEKRYKNIDIRKFRRKLKSIGAKITNPKRIMPLMVFEHPTKRKDSYIRVRDEGKQITLTSKQNCETNIQ